MSTPSFSEPKNIFTISMFRLSINPSDKSDFDQVYLLLRR